MRDTFCEFKSKRRQPTCLSNIYPLLTKNYYPDVTIGRQIPDMLEEQYVHVPQVLSTSHAGEYPGEFVPGITDHIISPTQP